MSTNGDDKPTGTSETGSGEARMGNRARELFGHKSGAKPWGDPPEEPTNPAQLATETSSAPYPRDASYTPRAEAERESSVIFSEVADEEDLTKLHPNYKLLMRFGALILAVIIVVVSLVVEAALRDTTSLPFGLVFGPAVLLAAFVAIRVPLARFNAKGYQISRDRLRVVRGIMFRSDTIVPFGRVQHIDVDQGPIERALGLATLTLHTAGSHNSSVHLPGLGHELAVDMREAIRAHIKRESQ